MKSNMKWDQLDFEQLKNENVWKILNIEWANEKESKQECEILSLEPKSK